MTATPEPRADRAGIVLAGGGARRFGSDKLCAVIDGQPLLHRSLRAVAACCSELIVSVAADGAPDLPPDLEVIVVRDPQPDQGPLAGLAAALTRATAATVLVVAGDMPSLEPRVLRLLADALEESPGAQMTALDDGGAVRPLPCAIAGSATGAVTALVSGGERRLRALLVSLRVTALAADRWRVVDPSGGSLVDIDRPEDL